jgi:hypothetical protein
MKKEKLFIAIPVIIIIALLAVIGFQLAKGQFTQDSSDSPNSATKSTGNGGQGQGGQTMGPAPGGGKITPPPGQ